jgi:hypothetical protein
LCRLMVPLSLKFASSDQTVKSGNDFLPSYMSKNYSQNWSWWSGSSSFRARSNLGTYVFHYLCRKMRRTLVLQTPVSQEHCVADFFADCVKSYNIVLKLSSSVELHGLSKRPLVTFCTIPSSSNISRNLVIVTGVGGGVQLIFPQSSHLSHYSFSSCI